MDFNFQFKDRSDDEWKTIDETLFMDQLYRHHNRLSPLVKTLLSGKVLSYPEGQYRIQPLSISKPL